MEHDLDVISVDLYFKDEDITVLNWTVNKFGFGQVVYNHNTGEIIDDEYMGYEFCAAIIDFYEKSV